jgi:hypothetical protein
MKRCAQCGRTYPDDSLAFCLDDGSLLSAPYDQNATLRMSPPTNPTPTEVLPSARMAEPAKARNNSLGLYLAIGLGALILGGVIVGWMMSGGAERSTNANDARQATETANANMAQSGSNSNETQRAMEAASANMARSAAKVVAIDISGNWRDQFGFVSHVSQQGDDFQLTSVGKSCRGRFLTTGAGTIRGKTLELNYTSSYSSGHCAGTISADGFQMTLDCMDTACGRFLTSTKRQ